MRARMMAGAARTGRETTSGQQAIARDASHGQDTEIRREAPPVAEDKQYGRKASPGQDERNNHEIGHFRTASISQATLRRTETTELTHKSNLVRDPAAGLRSLLSRIALVAINPASIPLRSIGGDSDSWLALSRPRRERVRQTRPN